MVSSTLISLIARGSATTRLWSINSAGEMMEALYQKLQTLQRELIVESAYFVVSERGIEAIQKLRDRGVKVRFLTNSLASNDVVAAHAGHAGSRKQLPGVAG